MSITITLYILFSLSLLHVTNAHDITQILNQYPDFSTFNSYLTQTNLTATINARQTITVLVVNNAAISSLSSTSSPDTLKNILSVHIILDYYDITKLQQLPSSSTLLTTLFQSTGQAKGQQGFLTVTHPSIGSTMFGSAMPGSTQGSTLVKYVAAQPYNISIIQISSPIIPQGIDGDKISSPSLTPPSTTTPPPPLTATAASPKAVVKDPVSSVAPPKPTKTALSSPPTMAVTPTSSSTPAASPATVGAAADAPAAEDPAGTIPVADKPKEKSAAEAIEIGIGLVCTTVLSSLYMISIIW